MSSTVAKVAALLRDYPRVATHDLVLVSDGAGWAIDEQARRSAAYLPASLRATIVQHVPPWTAGKTVHFIHRYAALEGDLLERLAGRNRLILTWTHGGATAGVLPELDALLQRFARVAHLFDRVHVWSSLYVPVLVRLGVSRERIVVVPMGVDAARFAPSPAARARSRAALGLLDDAACLGSFQRDGESEPKLVKGPDVLVELAERLRERVPGLLVLLTGPARGWVRRELERRGVPHRYFGFVPAAAVPRYFHACDLYAITAREEGGPMTLLEAMASGVPVVSTRVGMAADLVRGGRNGALAEVDDLDALTVGAASLLTDTGRAAATAREALETAAAYDWHAIGPRYAALYAIPASAPRP